VAAAPGNESAAAGSSPPPTRLLGAFTEEDVARAAAGGADPSLRWRAAEWHVQKDSIVALAFRPAELGARPESLEPRLVVLRGRASKLELVAEQKLDLSHAECPNESGEAPGGEDRAPQLALDLPAYTTAPGQTAIGVRFTCARTYPAAEGVETRLLLLELEDGKLRQVFDEKIASMDFDRVRGDTTTTSGVVSVQRQQHAGHFDLQLRLKTTTEGSDAETFPNTTRQPLERTQIRHFVWNGEHYQLARAR